MLKRIICEKFKTQPLEFSEGLNCVLGDDVGTNSIGKSTFIMIIDFVFGGNDYLKLDESTIKKIGPHEFKFTFKFNTEDFYFVRKTDDPEYIIYCDSEYNCVKKEPLEEYLKFLKEKYNLPNDLSIRDSIGRYFRVHPRENTNQFKPLNVARQEKESNAVIALLKLFDTYKIISNLLKELKNIEENKKGLKYAQNFLYIPNINKTKYKNNLNTIDKIKKEIDIAQEIIVSHTVNIEALMSSEISLLRRKKSFLISQINYLKNKIDEIVQSSISKNKLNLIDYNEILEFFPTIKIDQIRKIDNFHFEIQKIVSNEIKEYKTELDEQIIYMQRQLEKINQRMYKIANTNKDTQYALEKFSDLKEKLNKIELENKNYEQINEINELYNLKHEEYIKSQEKLLNDVESAINSSLVNLNDYIYNNSRLSPNLVLGEKKYTYNTTNDNGTGIIYKNLVILDLTILNLTSLPCIAHDSLILKQIQDDAMEKIAKKYEESEKQIFIAFDKLSSYTQVTQDIFNRHCKLRLGKDNELFGFSWCINDN